MKANLTLNCLKSYLQGRSNFSISYFEDNLAFFKELVFVELEKDGSLKKACRFSTAEESQILFRQWRENKSQVYWAWRMDKHSMGTRIEAGLYLVSLGQMEEVVDLNVDSRERYFLLENLCQDWAIPSQKIQSLSFVNLRGLSF